MNVFRLAHTNQEPKSKSHADSLLVQQGWTSRGSLPGLRETEGKLSEQRRAATLDPP
jgi:hypothetical protein